MMAGRILAVVVATGVVVLGGPSRGEPFSLMARLLDAKSERAPTSPTVGRVATDSGGVIKDLTQGGEGRYSGDLPATLSRVTVLVEARDRLVPRKIPLVLGPGTPKALPLTLYVVEREEVNYQYPHAPIAWYEKKDYDRALAAFEFAYDDLVTRGVGINKIRVKVEYYYGLALRSACAYLRYDTCAAAAERFDNLMRHYPGNEKYYEGLPLETLQTARKAADKIAVAGRYDGVRTAYKMGDFAAAAAAAEGLLADAEAGRVELAGSDVTPDRLRLDAASARAKLGDQLFKQAATADAIENYKAAVDLSKSVERLEKPRAIADAEFLSGKLAVIESGRRM